MQMDPRRRDDFVFSTAPGPIHIRSSSRCVIFAVLIPSHIDSTVGDCFDEDSRRQTRVLPSSVSRPPSAATKRSHPSPSSTDMEAITNQPSPQLLDGDIKVGTLQLYEF